MLFLSFLFSCSSEEAISAKKGDSKLDKKEATELPEGPKIIILGDSLTAGMGVSAEQAYPVLLSNILQKNELTSQVINAGVSGDTTAGGLRRIDWVLSQNPDLLLIELGTNDGLRGIPIKEITSNLHAMIDRAQQRNVDVFLIGMMIPPNYGEDYAAAFKNAFPSVSKEQAIPLLPFLLKDVAGVRDLNQSDGIHPTPKGHQIMAKTVYEFIEPWRRKWVNKEQ